MFRHLLIKDPDEAPRSKLQSILAKANKKDS